MALKAALGVMSVVLIPVAMSPGQATPYNHCCVQAGGNSFGAGIAIVGDVNFDGVSDFAGCYRSAGVAGADMWYYSGVDCTPLQNIGALTTRDDMSAIAAAGDRDGDTRFEALLGGPGWTSDQGYVRVLELNGTVAFFTGESAGDRFGASVAGAGDVDGDGSPDYVVGAPASAGKTGYVKLFSGSTLTETCKVVGQSTDDEFGFAVSGIGDVTGEGDMDFLIGAPGHNGTGSVTLYRILGSSCIPIRSPDFGAATGDRFGAAVSDIADLDGDGTRDYVVGAPAASGKLGEVHVLSGLTGVTLMTLPGITPAGQFGVAVSSAGDLNCDGIEDILIGADLADRVYVYSGDLSDPRLLYQVNGSGRLGSNVQGGGKPYLGVDADVTGDGVDDFVTGAPSAGSGQVCVETGVGIPNGDVLINGTGCIGSSGIQPLLQTYGGPSVSPNPEFGICLSRAEGGTPAFLFVGLTLLGNPLAVSCNCLLYPDFVVAFSKTTSNTGAGNGAASFPLALPPGIPAGTLIYSQIVVLEAPCASATEVLLTQL